MRLSAGTMVDGKFRYETDDTNQTATLVGKDPALSTLSGAITIPGAVNGYTVISIGNSAFYGCSALTKLVFMPKTPPTITSNVFNATYFTATNCIFYAPGGIIDAQNYSYIKNRTWNPLINKNQATLKRGTSVKIDAADFINPDSVKWSSSNETIATVDANGKVTAKKLGNATITANFGNGSDVCAVNVIIPAEAVTLDKTETTLNKGTSVQLKATVAPVTTTNKTVKWTSSNNDIATVDSLGNVTAVAVGTATITATCNVTVFNILGGSNGPP